MVRYSAWYHYDFTFLEDQLVFTQKEVPWRSIIRSRPLWALLINHVGIIWCTYTFGTRMPDYVNEVLKVSYELQTYWGLIMVFSVFVATIIYGCFSDWLIAEKHINITVLRKYSIAFSKYCLYKHDSFKRMLQLLSVLCFL